MRITKADGSLDVRLGVQWGVEGRGCFRFS